MMFGFPGFIYELHSLTNKSNEQRKVQYEQHKVQ